MTGSAKLHCNMCHGMRWHDVLYETNRHSADETDDGLGFDESARYRLAECRGCEFISLHIEWSASSQPEPIHHQWPPQVARSTPKWMRSFPWLDAAVGGNKQELLEEIYAAATIGNRRLAALGLRALLEAVMVEQVGDHHSFVENVKAFKNAGFISIVQHEAISPVLEIGHASMHRGHCPSSRDVDAALDVVENIIESIYISGTRAALIEQPSPRPKRT